jgi:hypothetical protein
MIKGTYSANDLFSATWVHLRPRRSFAIIGLVLAVLYCGTMWFVFLGPGAAAEQNSWVRWACLGSGAYLAVSFGVGVSYRARRNFTQRKDLQRECAFEPSETGLTYTTPHAQGVKPWGDYLKWKEGKSVFLVYLSDNMYQLIPKRFFVSEDAISSFRATLKERIARHEA